MHVHRQLVAVAPAIIRQPAGRRAVGAIGHHTVQKKADARLQGRGAKITRQKHSEVQLVVEVFRLIIASQQGQDGFADCGKCSVVGHGV